MGSAFFVALAMRPLFDPAIAVAQLGHPTPQPGIGLGLAVAHDTLAVFEPEIGHQAVEVLLRDRAGFYRRAALPRRAPRAGIPP